MTPSALGSNPRVVKEANTLQDAGYAVTVISVRTLDAVDGLDDTILSEAQWRSVRLDFRSARRRRWPRVRQIANGWMFSAFNGGLFANRSVSPFTSALTRAAVRMPADLYIAHYPGALPAAMMAARRHGVGFSFDAEDFHFGETSGHAQRVLKAIETLALPQCKYVSAASPGIADAYRDEYNIDRPTVILNVFPCSNGPASPSDAGVMSPGPSVYWFSQVIGPNRGLECAVKAVALSKSRPHLYLRGQIAEGFDRVLESLATQSGVGGHLHFLPTAKPSELEKLAAAFDIGLSCETNYNINRQISLANKIFSYLIAGIPSILSANAAHSRLLPEVGSACRLFVPDDPGSLAAEIDKLLENPRLLAEARAAAFALGRGRFNWDQEQDILRGLVAKAL